ncbi:MAG: DUF63 family protein, partial [Candidatus Diapherotrites archaeon]|nr:DUF63 family protein [Candidatus Diapherotrites archaeon]
MGIQALLYDLFGKRIAESGTYGAVEYAVYGAIMLALCFFVIFPILDRRKIRFNARFMLALLPYILFGSALRVLEDMRVLPSSWNPLEPAYYFVTPGIYLLVAAITIAALFVSQAVAKKNEKLFFNFFAAIGLVLCVPVVIFELLNFRAWLGFVAVLALVAVIVASLFFAFKKINSKILAGNLNVLALSSQALDGSATFVATQFFRCGEQHPLSDFLLQAMPFS